MSALSKLAFAVLLLAQGAPVRPREAWVMRTALDGRPRAVVLALNANLWAAYDLDSCSLYKVWSGDITTDPEGGSKSRGTTFTESAPGAVWWIEENGKAQPADAKFRGCRFQQKQVVLEYELATPSGAKIQIEETPEFERPEDLDSEPTNIAPWMKSGLLGLRRSLKATGVPAGVHLSLTVRARCVGYVDYDRILPEGERELEEGGVKLRELFARLLLDASSATHEIHFFFALPPAAPVQGK